MDKIRLYVMFNEEYYSFDIEDVSNSKVTIDVYKNFMKFHNNSLSKSVIDGLKNKLVNF
jgi:hypothetical protein